MEFDKNKILTVVTADQAKVGSMGHFSNYIPTLAGYVTIGCKPDKLMRVSLNTIYPFYDGHNYYSLFYPAPEPTHADRQAEWVKEHNIQVGTKVRITRDFGRDEEAGTTGHSGVAGTTGKVWGMGPHYIDVVYDQDRKVYTTPYYVLEVIKEPTYRPYNNDELNDLVGEVLTNKYTGNNKLVTERLGPSAVRVGDTGCTSKDLFHYFTLNGEPCGVREEA
jgi:hypothetical protein